MTNKLLPAKIILVLIIMLSFGVIMGVVGYSLTLKKAPPVAVQPTIEPTVNPAPTLEPISSKNDNFAEIQLENLKEGKNNIGGVSFEFQTDPKEFWVGSNKYILKEGESDCGAYQCYVQYNLYMADKNGKLIAVGESGSNPLWLSKITEKEDTIGEYIFMNYNNLLYLFTFDVSKSAGRCFPTSSITIHIIDKANVVSQKYFRGNIQLLAKDAKLYIKAENNFCYESYTCSIPSLSPEIGVSCDCGVTDGTFPCADDYYLIDNGNITNTNLEFRPQYLEQINKNDAQLKTTNWTNEPEGEKWFYPLMERTLNYIFAGDKDKAWETFDKDSSEFSKKYPLKVKVDASSIRKEVEEKINTENESN